MSDVEKVLIIVGMEELMERGVHAAALRIFLILDTRSLRNAACVCKSWRRYVQHV
jgi:hypothetical protein